MKINPLDTAATLRQQVTRLRAALADALVAVNNLALCHPAESHKSVLLRKHPYCSELDFCILSDARDREARAAAVLTDTEPQP